MDVGDCTFEMLQETLTKKRVVIIGAGMSGLTCAEHLQRYGFTNVRILEASERIGGRLYTFESKKRIDEKGCNYLEMGSQRVHTGTSVFEIAKESNQIVEDAPDYVQSLKKFSPAYGKAGISIIKNLQSRYAYQSLLPKSVFDLDILEEKEFLDMKNKEKRLFKIALSYMVGSYAWWYGLSYEYTFERKQKELLYGYSGVLQSIVQRLSPSTIFSNKEVIKIDWSDFEKRTENYSSDTAKIKIKCRDESTYEADHVIIAIPLGYLKENYKFMFSPSLPEKKIKAIEELQFVTVNKIFLEFETPFWEPSDVYHVIWSNRMDKLLDNFTNEAETKLREWISYINRFEYVYANPNYLCAWIFGKGAIKVEKVPDGEIAEGCMVLLRYLTMTTYLPYPKRIARSSWYSNRLFRGSLVHDPSRPIHRLIQNVADSVFLQEMQETESTITRRMRPILQFTGDVAFMDTMSSVEGARECGTRAAVELLEYCAFPEQY